MRPGTAGAKRKEPLKDANDIRVQDGRSPPKRRRKDGVGDVWPDPHEREKIGPIVGHLPVETTVDRSGRAEESGGAVVQPNPGYEHAYPTFIGSCERPRCGERPYELLVDCRHLWSIGLLQQHFSNQNVERIGSRPPRETAAMGVEPVEHLPAKVPPPSWGYVGT